MKYKVRCYEKNIWELEVEADSKEEAETRAEEHYGEFGFEHYKEISSPEGWYWKAEEVSSNREYKHPLLRAIQDIFAYLKESESVGGEIDGWENLQKDLVDLRHKALEEAS